MFCGEIKAGVMVVREVLEKKTRIQMLGLAVIGRMLANNTRESKSNGSILSDVSSAR